MHRQAGVGGGGKVRIQEKCYVPQQISARHCLMKFDIVNPRTKRVRELGKL
jgi:hypothetical protein